MKKLELDFSDIAAEKTSPETTVKEKEVPKEESKSMEHLSGIMLQIPSLYEAKDLVLCTAEEFSEWVASVWPCVDVPPNEVGGPVTRNELFKRIVYFNQTLRFTNKPKNILPC